MEILTNQIRRTTYITSISNAHHYIKLVPLKIRSKSSDWWTNERLEKGEGLSYRTSNMIWAVKFFKSVSFRTHKKSTYSISSNNLIKIQMYRTFTDGHLVKIYSENWPQSVIFGKKRPSWIEFRPILLWKLVTAGLGGPFSIHFWSSLLRKLAILVIFRSKWVIFRPKLQKIPVNFLETSQSFLSS